jgi:uncharacterized tellurite resistance protein B-like protein
VNVTSDDDQAPRSRRVTVQNLMEKRVREVIGGALRPNDPRRFLVEAMIGAMNADGQVDAREMAVLDKHLAEHDLFQGVPERGAKTLIELATDAIKFAGSATARVPAIAKGLPSRIHRLAAYAMAVEVVQADLDVTHAEMAFLEALRQSVRVGPYEAQQIFAALHDKRLAPHLDDRVLRIRSLVPVAVEIFTLRAHALGKATDDHRHALKDFFLAMPDLMLPPDDIEGELFRAFRKPRAAGFNVLLELQQLAQGLPDAVDRWWLVVYALAAEPPGTTTNWRVIPFAGLLQHAFGLADGDMDLAAADAQIFPPNLPRP